MPEKYEEEEIECKIVESYGIFSQGIKFWNKEVNLVSWNGRPPKLDIRNWQMDHAKCGKGIALTREEAEGLAKLLGEILASKPRVDRQKSSSGRASGNASMRGKPGKTEVPKRRTKPAPPMPKTLEPFYRELKLSFGAGPDECKTARNILLKKYHPDMNAGNAAAATRKTIKIKEAYEAIMKWWNIT